MSVPTLLFVASGFPNVECGIYFSLVLFIQD